MLLLLIAGATLNVAVAWGCAMYGKVYSAPELGNRYDIDDGNLWVVEVIQGPVKGQAFSSRFFHTGGRYGENRLPQFPAWWVLSRDPPVNMQSSFRQQVSGWPQFSMWCEFSFIYDQQNHRHVSPRGAILIDSQDPIFILVPRLLPFRPLWPGFAVNTLFYAGVLWMVFAGPFAMRRMIRRRRGRCAACAYPIGTSEVCTECGTPHVATKPM